MPDQNQIIPWLPLIGPSIAAFVAVVSWYVGHRLSLNKDLSSKRRELRVQYLIEAYRRLENAANRTDSEKGKDFESAIADIQLFGSGRQIGLVHELIESMSKDGFVTVNLLLELLRTELRHELGMRPDSTKIKIFRFSKSGKPCKDSADAA